MIFFVIGLMNDIVEFMKPVWLARGIDLGNFILIAAKVDYPGSVSVGFVVLEGGDTYEIYDDLNLPNDPSYVVRCSFRKLPAMGADSA